MKHLLLLVCCGWLLHFTAHAQTSISGRVLDNKSSNGLPSVTILQTNTTNGVSSDAEGYFTLIITGQPDSVALTISAIGYVTINRVVAPSSKALFRLVMAPVTLCDLQVYHRFRVALTSGLRYTPFGGGLTLTHPRMLRSQLSATGYYRTNFLRNQVWGVSLGFPSVRRNRRISFYESASYSKSHISSANIAFESGDILAGINFGNVRWPAVYAGIGFGRLRTFLPDSFNSSTGANYALGLGYRLPLGFYTTAKVTRWPNSWQWQGSLDSDLPGSLYVSLALNHLRSYNEVSISLSRAFN